jgi:mannosyltransferase
MGPIELTERPSMTDLPRSSRRGIPFLAVTLGVIATAISALGSWVPSLWGDEVTSVLSAERSLPSLFRMLGNIDAVHGTYYFFLHFWVGAFGASPFSVRFPSAIAVGIVIAGVVVLADRLADQRTAVIAGVIAALLPRVTYMGEEARGYAMSASCAVWVTILLLHIIRSDRVRGRLWVLYAIGIALGAYVFLFSALIVVTHLVMVLLMGRPGLLKRWIRAVASGVALALPVIIYGIAERGQIAFLADRNSTDFRTLAVTQWFGNDGAAIVAWSLIAAAVVVTIVRFVRARAAGTTPVSPDPSTRPHLVPVAFVWLVGSAGILLVANAIHPVYSSRYLSFAIPAAALLIGWLIARISVTWIAVALTAVVLATSSISYFSERTPYAKNGSDWAQVADVIQHNAKPGDGILFDEGSRPSQRLRLAMRGYPQSFVRLHDIALRSYWWQTLNWRDSTYLLSEVTGRLDGITTVWMLEYRAPGGTAHTYNLATLASLGYTVTETFFEHSSVILKFTKS